ncbi:uncharacterized protein LOC122960983 [Acropora millepora]|uniref:uncharacterized protein LOC122960983 n=1 Tax=Acropora millepora TaxID=45264 RepID=UPI001CF46A4D|nr:uncharacterized protein LOC122960983 [Acropora millepora]
MFFVKERPPLIKQKYCRKEDPRLSVTSSYHLNQSTLRGNTGYTCEKNGYSFVNAHRLQKNLRRICQLIAVSCKIAATSQIRELESLHTPKSNSELAKWKSFVRTHSSNFNLNGLFKIYSVHFSSDCFEWTVHKEGAPRRLITGSIPTIWKPSVESTTSAISARSRRLRMNCKA